MPIDIPPMPDHPPTVGTPGADWWERLYGTEAETQPSSPETTPIEPARDGEGRRRLGLIPDWRKGPITDLSPDANTDAADEDNTQADTTDTQDTDTADTVDSQDTDAADTEPETPDGPPPAPDPPALSDTAAAWIRSIHTPGDADETDDRGTGLVHRVRTTTRRKSVRLLIYFGTAAGAGWHSGIPQWVHAQITEVGVSEGVGGGIAIGCIAIGVSLIPAVIARHIGAKLDHLITFALREDQRLGIFDPVFGWVGSIPLASSILALALYTPAAPTVL